MEDLLEIEEWPEYNRPYPASELYLVQHIACRICLKLLRRDRFSRLFRRYFSTRQNIPENMKDITIRYKQGQVCISCAINNKLPEYNEPDEYYIGEGADNLELYGCYGCDRYFPKIHLTPDFCLCQSCRNAFGA